MGEDPLLLGVMNGGSQPAAGARKPSASLLRAHAHACSASDRPTKYKQDPSVGPQCCKDFVNERARRADQSRLPYLGTVIMTDALGETTRVRGTAISQVLTGKSATSHCEHSAPHSVVILSRAESRPTFS